MQKINELQLAKELIRFPTVTPVDAGVMKFLEKKLKKLGFKTKLLEFKEKDFKPVKNLYARLGRKGPNFCYAGHLDVVPPGNIKDWTINPFKPSVKNNHLIGRGANDMKSSVAAFVSAVSNFLSKNEKFNGSISLLITGDEEGDAINGTKKVVEYLKKRKEKINFCLVGEPTNPNKLGEMIKIGRRGSLTGKLNIIGHQGHVAYPEKAENPIHISSKIIYEFLDIKFDNGNKYFPPTSFQISNINSGTGVDNVIPANIKIAFNIRYSTETNHDEIKDTIIKILDNSNAKYDITWKHSGEPYLTTNHEFIDICKDSIEEITNIKTLISTNGGTSDGRFMAKVCKQVVELGLTNRSIHKINECVKEDDLMILVEIYKNILSKIFIK